MVWNSREREREREREMMAIEDIYYRVKDTRTTRRLKTSIEPN